MTWTTRRVNGFTLSTLGEGPLAIIALHGGPGLSDYMTGLEDEFATVMASIPGVSAYAYQQRGIAPSPVDGPHTIEQHTADLLGIMDGLGLESAVLLGHSWGGHFAMHVAASHPERVRALISVDALGAIADGGEMAMGTHFDALLTPEDRAIIAKYDHIPEAEQTEEMFLEVMTALWKYYFADPASAPSMPPLQATMEGHLGTWASVKEHFDAETLVKLLPGFTNPSLFIAVSKGPIPAAANVDSAALVPGADVVVLETGHFPWLEQPGLLGPMIADFLRRRLSL